MIIPSVLHRAAAHAVFDVTSLHHGPDDVNACHIFIQASFGITDALQATRVSNDTIRGRQASGLRQRQFESKAGQNDLCCKATDGSHS